MIYLDSAATSFRKPRSVARAVARAMETLSSPGRGGYESAMLASDTLLECRLALQRLFHVPEPENVVFTLNATHALNIAIRSLVPPGGRAVISGWEHNAVTRPLHALRAELRVAPGAALRRRGLPGGLGAGPGGGSGRRRLYAGLQRLRLGAAPPGGGGALPGAGDPPHRGCLPGGGGAAAGCGGPGLRRHAGA